MYVSTTIFALHSITDLKKYYLPFFPPNSQAEDISPGYSKQNYVYLTKVSDRNL